MDLHFTLTNRKGTGFKVKLVPMIMLAFSTMLFIGCSTDDDDDMDPDLTGEIESAVTIVYRIIDSNSDTWFIEAYEDIPNEVDIATVTEVGQRGSTVNPIDGAVLVWNGEGLITKWAVDRTNLDIFQDGTIDIAELGVEGDIGTIVSKSTTEAYLMDNKIGVIVKFNPEVMEVLEVITYTPYNPVGWFPNDPNEPFVNTFQHRLNGDLIIAPFLTGDFNDATAPYEAIMFVFNTLTNEVQFVTDDRIATGNDRFITAPNGNMYYPNSWAAGLLTENNPNHDVSQMPSTSTILRFLPNGTWDQDFILEMNDIDPGMLTIWRPQFVVGNEMVVSYWPPNTPLDPEGGISLGIFGQTRVAATINLETFESRPFTALDQYNGFNIIGEFDGKTYIGAFPAEGPGILVRQDGIDIYTEVLTSAEGVQLRQVAQLW
ncbi:MAG: hypothetical protein AAF620_12295 [Bacteroidota bacterium]